MRSDFTYIGPDVHQGAIAIAVLNDSAEAGQGNGIETKDSSILQFLHGLRGELHVTLEEGTGAAWLTEVKEGSSAVNRY